jgi:small GTP-binding protein
MKNFTFSSSIDDEKKEDEKKKCSINIQFFDTAGQERFHSITTSYYRGASGVLFVYDVTSLESFECIQTWARDINLHCYQNNVQMVKMLIGNKCDLASVDSVSTKMGQDLAEKLDAKFLETSVKKDINVDEMFSLLSKDLFQFQLEKKLERQQQQQEKLEKEKILLSTINENNEEDDNKCCK